VALSARTSGRSPRVSSWRWLDCALKTCH
jgi:hypothetical protein